MTRRHRQLAALAVCAALLPAGCGSDDEEPAPGVPRQTAEQLSRELDLLQERLDVTRRDGKIGSCDDIDGKSYPDIRLLVEGLPADTDPEVRRALGRGLDRLKELTESECEQLAREIREREEATPEPTPPPAPVPPPTTPPEQTETDKDDDEKDKEKPKKEEGDGTGGVGPDDQDPPGQGGGGQPAPTPAPEEE